MIISCNMIVDRRDHVQYLKFSGINLPVHRALNRSQLALFNFHFGLWSSAEKVFCSMLIEK